MTNETKKTKHTRPPTPWVAKLEDRLLRDGVEVFDADGSRIFHINPEDTMEISGGQIVECLSREQKLATKHMLACVNACDGINPEAVPDLLMALNRIAYEPQGPSDASHEQVLAAVVEIAKAALTKAGAR